MVRTKSPLCRDIKRKLRLRGHLKSLRPSPATPRLKNIYWGVFSSWTGRLNAARWLPALNSSRGGGGNKTLWLIEKSFVRAVFFLLIVLVVPFSKGQGWWHECEYLAAQSVVAAEQHKEKTVLWNHFQRDLLWITVRRPTLATWFQTTDDFVPWRYTRPWNTLSEYYRLGDGEFMIIMLVVMRIYLCTLIWS